MFKSLLANPLTRGLDMDSPEMTTLRGQIIKENPFLNQIYLEWYSCLVKTLQNIPEGSILEIGSAGGFLNEFHNNIITTDVIFTKYIDVILDGHQLPFQSASLSGVLMTNVLHHLHQPRRFFTESARCVQPGGVITMLEPWVTLWSRFVYGSLHHEPFQPDVEDWEFQSSGPLSSANGALPWIIFKRDQDKFVCEFPEWHIQEISLNTPFRYLISGGVSMRSLMPSRTFGFWSWFESLFQPWFGNIAMFARIVLLRTTR